MNAPVFVDTNVFVYWRDATDPAKQERAAEWLRWLWHQGTGRVSQQVLHEYYVTVTRKLPRPLPLAEAREDVNDLLSWSPVVNDPGLMSQAWRLEDAHSFSWWDSLIVAAALRQECAVLLSEDMQDELRIGSMRILNPFRATPREMLQQTAQ